MVLKYFKESVKTIESIRGQIHTTSGKAAFLGSKKSTYTYVIKTLLKLKNGRSAFEYHEKAKARTFLDEIASVGFTRPSREAKKTASQLKFSNPKVEKYIRKERELMNQVNFIYKKIAEIRSKGKCGATLTLQKLLDSKLKELKKIRSKIRLFGDEITSLPSLPVLDI